MAQRKREIEGRAKRPAPEVPHVVFRGSADPEAIVALAQRLLAAGFGVQISAVSTAPAARGRSRAAVC